MVVTNVLTETKQVRKWGNGLGIHIPKNVADRLKLVTGDEVVMTVADEDSFTVEVKHLKNVLQVPEFTAEDIFDEEDGLVSDIELIDWGYSVGAERI